MGLGIFDDGIGKPALLVVAQCMALRVDQRAIVLHQPLKRFPGEIEPVEHRIATFEPGHDAQRLGVVVEAAIGLHQPVEFALAGMAERRVAEVMGERQGLGQILIEAQGTRDRAGDLGHLERMSEPCPVVIALVIDENLRLVLEPAEGRGMDDAIAVPRKGASRRAFGLGNQAAPALI